MQSCIICGQPANLMRLVGVYYVVLCPDCTNLWSEYCLGLDEFIELKTIELRLMEAAAVGPASARAHTQTYWGLKLTILHRAKEWVELNLPTTHQDSLQEEDEQ